MLCLASSVERNERSSQVVTYQMARAEFPPIHVTLSRCRVDYHVDLALKQGDSTSHTYSSLVTVICQIAFFHSITRILYYLAWSPREASNRYHGQIVSSIPLRSSDHLQLLWTNRPGLQPQSSDASEPDSCTASA